MRFVTLLELAETLACLEPHLIGRCRYALVIQAPAYCSSCYHFNYFQKGSLHLLGIWLRDICILLSPKLWFMLVTPSVAARCYLTNIH